MERDRDEVSLGRVGGTCPEGSCIRLQSLATAGCKGRDSVEDQAAGSVLKDSAQEAADELLVFWLGVGDAVQPPCQRLAVNGPAQAR